MPTVLIVEDEWVVSDWLELLLGEQGYTTRTASNGLEALEAMRGLVPDVVLTDFTMPKLDGAGLCAAMRADARLAGIPLVVMTSLMEEKVRERMAGYAAYLRKPFRDLELIRTLASAMPAR